MKKNILISIFLIHLFLAFTIYSQVAKDEWSKISSERNIESYQNFIKKFPNSKYAAIAKTKIDTLLAPIEEIIKKTDRMKCIFGEGMSLLGINMYVNLPDKDGKETTIAFPASGQENGILITKQAGTLNGKVFPLTNYKALPFSPPENLKVDNSKMLFDSVTINILFSRSGFLFPNIDSSVPLRIDMSNSQPSVEYWCCAIGIIWEFDFEGIKFKAGSVEYISKEKGAKIKFTEYGLEFEKMIINYLSNNKKTDMK